jgi:hypothetical protein
MMRKPRIIYIGTTTTACPIETRGSLTSKPASPGAGRDLVLTPEEAEGRAREAADRAREAADRAREAAEQRVAELEAELRLRKG